MDFLAKTAMGAVGNALGMDGGGKGGDAKEVAKEALNAAIKAGSDSARQIQMVIHNRAYHNSVLLFFNLFFFSVIEIIMK